MPEVPPESQEPHLSEPPGGGATPFDRPAPRPDADASARSASPFEARPPAPPSSPAPWGSAPAPTAGASPFRSEAAALTTGLPQFAPPGAVPELPAGAPRAVAEEPPRPRRSLVRPLARGVREIAETVVLALLIFLLVRSVVQNFQVEGRSMEPTLESSWYLLVNKALYWEINLDTVHKFVPFIEAGDDPTRYVFRGPHRGDVIVFRSPDSRPGEPERDFIKRIIAVPGETVEVRDCTVFIDGEPLDEPYIAEAPQYTYGPETVPPGHYFVLGDNRNNSSDSHSWGMLPKENIIGRAWLTYWPFGSFGLIDNTSVEPNENGEVVSVPAATCS